MSMINGVNSLLLDLPTEFASERLLLRCYRPGDGARYARMLQKNREHLYEFLPPSLMAVQIEEDAEIVIRRLMTDWNLRNLFTWSEGCPPAVCMRGSNHPSGERAIITA